MESKEKERLEKIARQIRRNILTSIYYAKSGHPGGSLSIADILAVLYFKEMKVNPKNPTWEDRDRLVLSKGHCAPALYSALSINGYFPEEDLVSLRNLTSYLQGHPDMTKVPGVDMTTGSLGQGLSVANGMALAAKLDHKSYRVYAILGDGEIEEGQIWEAAMSSCKYRLDNLCVILDYNHLQIDGTIEKVKGLTNIPEKFEAFGFNIIDLDGHKIEEIGEAFEKARRMEDKPTILIAHTIKGKGVSYMENKAEWHGKAPTEEQFKQAMKELEV